MPREQSEMMVLSLEAQPDKLIRAVKHRDRQEVLPTSLAPRGLTRFQAAAYIGVSASLFDELVRDGRMPKPKLINTRTVWDRIALDEAFAALPDRTEKNPWDG